MVRTSRPLVERMTLVWHDWFATSNGGVGSQKLMLKQNKLFRSHSLGSFEQLLLDVTRDPAMLLWLNGTYNSKDAPNENYAPRDDGALHARRRPRRVHRARRARAGAVADGLPERLEAGARRLQLPLRPAPARHRDEGGLPQGRGATTGSRPAASASRTRCTRRSSCASSGATSCRSHRITRRRLRSKRCTATATRCSPCSQAILQHPGALHRAADGEAAGRPRRRPAAPDQRGDHDDRLVVDRLALRPAALLPAERRRLGRHALARHRDLSRPLDRRAADPAGSQARSRQSARRRPMRKRC